MYTVILWLVYDFSPQSARPSCYGFFSHIVGLNFDILAFLPRLSRRVWCRARDVCVCVLASVSLFTFYSDLGYCRRVGLFVIVSLPMVVCVSERKPAKEEEERSLSTQLTEVAMATQLQLRAGTVSH